MNIFHHIYLHFFLSGLIFISSLSAYDILLREFQSCGDLEEHVVTSGPHKDERSYKQKWRHILSGYKYTWHHKPDKQEFQRDRIWKAARCVRDKKLLGYKRVDFILNLKNKPCIAGSNLERRSRERDMVLRVKATLAIASGSHSLYLFQEDYMRDYLQSLDPRHTPPHQHERIHLLEVIMDRAMLELLQIIGDARARLVNSFMTGTIDFWTDSHRREPYAVMMIDLIAEKYRLSNGRCLFMSRKTRSETSSNLVLGEAILDLLESPLNFECFEGESK